MNKGKFTQIIDNIILNSEYWLKESKKLNSKLKPKITIEPDEPVIKIYDNGMGVEPSIENRIFQPFVTGKPKKIGRGLGLFIVQQLLDTVQSQITLLNDKNSHNRRYIFRIDLTNIII
jgi:C4-dicarboxylate-specific signal transduction histidine kinase